MGNTSVFTARCLDVEASSDAVDGRVELFGGGVERVVGGWRSVCRGLPDVEAPWDAEDTDICLDSFLYSLYFSAVNAFVGE